MSVLSVAKSTGAGGTPDSAPVGQSTNSRSAQTVDLAERITVAAEDFLEGLVPVAYRIELDWGTLAPIISTLSTAATLTLALTR